jgi:hypothetical protein
MRGMEKDEMNTEIFKKQFSAVSFFTVLFGMLGWAIAGATAFYILAMLFSTPQLEGYYLNHSQGCYEIKAYWRFGIDTTVYKTYNGKEALMIFNNLNTQSSPLKILPKE